MNYKRAVTLICLSSVLFRAIPTMANTVVNGDLILSNSGELVFSDGSAQSKAQVQGPPGVQGSQGPAGPANTLMIGTVSTGVTAEASIVGVAPNQALNLTLPQGPQGPIGPPGPSVGGWTVTSQNNFLATSGSAYLLTNAAQTTVTLPASPVVGDLVRVMAKNSSGGWFVRANSGQWFWGWTPHESNRSWENVASSRDGSKLVAVVRGGKIFISSDSGTTWTTRESNRQWMNIASSSDGTKLVAVDYPGKIYTSIDSGETWVPRESNRAWWDVASNSDGTKLVAVSGGDQIYTSTDSGVTWTPRMTDTSRNWRSVASSSDGTKLIAANYGSTGGKIYTSTDSGVTWTPRENDRHWNAVASSGDGTKLVAVVNGGQIHTSTDRGVTWKPRMTDSDRYWQDVASSIDGTKLVATCGQVYSSIDSGVTWTAQVGLGLSKIASSADGSKLVAVVSGGQIYTNTPPTSLMGAGGSGAEFIYVDNGEWAVR